MQGQLWPNFCRICGRAAIRQNLQRQQLYRLLSSEVTDEDLKYYKRKSQSKSTALQTGDSQDGNGKQESKRKGAYTDQMNVLNGKNNFVQFRKISVDLAHGVDSSCNVISFDLILGYFQGWAPKRHEFVIRDFCWFHMDFGLWFETKIFLR